jgi:hypothetical protein
VLLEGIPDAAVEGATDHPLLGRQGLHPQQQHDRELVQAVDALIVEAVDDQRPDLGVLRQFVANAAQDLDDAVDILAIADADARHRVGEILGQVLDAGDLAERHRVHDAVLVAQPDRADGDRLDDAGVLLPDIDDVADRDLVLNQDEQAGDDVLDQGLAAEPDGHPDHARAGQQRRDVDADLRQHDQGRDRDDHAGNDGPQ